MSAWWSGSARTFLDTDRTALCRHLASEAMQRFRVNEQTQLRAWDVSLSVLAEALRSDPALDEWRVILEFGIVRLGTRADAVLVCPDGIVVLEFKVGATSHDNAARRQVEDYAIDLQDFHAGSRGRPIVPILVATEADAGLPIVPLLIGGASAVLDASRTSLGPSLVALAARLPETDAPIEVGAWERAAYQPVPGIIDAARHLFARHDVAEIASARADATNLTRTIGAIDRLLAQAQEERTKLALFVTGVPGAGKTLCGLAVTFAEQAVREESVAFLTGNPTLVHVLRAALVRDAVHGGLSRGAAKQRMSGFIQELPRFRDGHWGDGSRPPERVIVVDEAQRSWTAAQAIRKSRDRPVRLDRSEPAILLDVMARHEGFAAIVCLVGNGQEIHDGEGGLAEWSAALSERPEWRVGAPPTALADPRPRSRLNARRPVLVEPTLHLTVPVRSLRHSSTPDWVDAVLSGDETRAREIAEGEALPFRLVRDAVSLRARLRDATEDRQRCGLVASAGASRLRAEGLGCELPHTDPDAVAHWFLDSWAGERDVRASDALELVATQFSIQGLELDQVGLAWDADLVRDGGAWLVRRFAGRAWQRVRTAEAIENVLNTYRVLLTRARFDTVIYIPRGDVRDPTRDPLLYEGIASYLASCGVTDAGPGPPAPAGPGQSPGLQLNFA